MASPHWFVGLFTKLEPQLRLTEKFILHHVNQLLQSKKRITGAFVKKKYLWRHVSLRFGDKRITKLGTTRHEGIKGRQGIVASRRTKILKPQRIHPSKRLSSWPHYLELRSSFLRSYVSECFTGQLIRFLFLMLFQSRNVPFLMISFYLG